MTKKVGRPASITQSVVSILVSSFQNGFSVKEACWTADISRETYYKKLTDDPEFTDIMSRAQASVSMNAKKVVLDAINSGDVSAAKWWLERKSAKEFSKEPILDITYKTSHNKYNDLSKDELNKLGKLVARKWAKEDL